MNSAKDYEKIPVQDDHMCFACGPANPSGLRMQLYADSDSVVSRLVVPGHLRGWSDLVHGGVISTILDEIMSWTAIHLLKKIILTQSMTVEFIKPIRIGQPLQAVGKIVEIKNDRHAVLEGRLFSEPDTLCARAQGEFALLKPKVALKLKVVSEDELHDILPE
jgi:uncharacterized protein (TIGR00369 family)